jgi:hypothetical protein
MKDRLLHSAEIPVAHNKIDPPYNGLLPSEDLCNYVDSVKDRHMIYFDDGLRMIYSKPDRVVETNNAEAIYLISYPPEGFEWRDHLTARSA